MGGVCLAVGRPVFQVSGRHEIFQHDLLPLGNLVKLIKVDEGKRGQSEVQVCLVFEVDAVVVVLTLVTRQQDAAERGLAAALSPY